MAQFDHRHFGQPQLAGSGQSAMSANNAVISIYQEWGSPAIFHDAGGDLGHLRLGVGPWIAGKGNERLNQTVFDGERVQIKDSEEARDALETTKPADDQTVGGLWKWVWGANLQTPQTLQTSVCSRALSKGRALASRMVEATGRTRRIPVDHMTPKK